MDCFEMRGGAALDLVFTKIGSQFSIKYTIKTRIKSFSPGGRGFIIETKTILHKTDISNLQIFEWKRSLGKRLGSIHE